MDNTYTIITTISVILALIASVYGIYSNKKKNTNMDTTEAAQNGKSIGTILSDLGYIKSSLDDIKRKQSENDKQVLSIIKDVTELTAFKKNTEDRLSKIEDDIKDLNK